MKQQFKKNGSSTPPERLPYIEPPPTAFIEEQGRSLLLESFDVVRRHKGALALIALFGLSFSLLVTLSQTPIYQARASLEIRNLNENFLNLRDINPTVPSIDEDGSGAAQVDLTQVKILQSASVLERVITTLNLEKKLTGKNGKNGGLFSARRGALGLSTWRKALGLPQSKPLSPRETVLGLIRKNLTVKAEPDTRLVEITYDSKDPQLAADFVNTLTSEFIKQNLEARSNTTQQTGEWLAGQLENVRAKLEESEEELQNYAQSSGLQFTSQEVGSNVVEDNVAEEKLRQLQEQLSIAHGDRVAKQSIYESASTAPPESLPEVLDDKTLEDYHVKLTDLRRQLAELSVTLTQANPAVKKVHDQIGALELALEKERANVIQRIRNEYDTSYRRENMLAANYTSEASQVSEQAGKVAHYNILKSDVDSNRQLYDSMLRNVQEAGMSSALQDSNIRVVDPATVPERPYKPNPLLNSALGLFGGVIFGLIFIVMRERSNRSIQAPGEATSSFGLPELGVIPALGAERSRFFSYYQEKGRRTGLTLKKEKQSLQVELITAQRTPSVLADCFRAATTSILYAGENGTRPRVIAVTSGNMREGKTTIASNLALAFAEISSSVLLIDGDLRKGRLHEIFHVSNSWGISDLLAGRKPPEGLSKAYFETRYEHLCLLPSGSTPSSIAGLLHSQQALEFLNKMREAFQIVIIDTPPMLQMPDARVLGRLADGIVLVVRSAQTTRDEAAAAAKRLLEDGSRVLGTILNDWNPHKTSSKPFEYQHYCYQQNNQSFDMKLPTVRYARPIAPTRRP